jgi:hypothetical protein
MRPGKKLNFRKELEREDCIAASVAFFKNYFRFLDLYNLVLLPPFSLIGFLVIFVFGFRLFFYHENASLFGGWLVIVGGRQADATVMAATAAAASARPAVRSSNNLILRRSGSLMDFSGEAFFFPTNKTSNSFTVLSLCNVRLCVHFGS